MLQHVEGRNVHDLTWHHVDSLVHQVNCCSSEGSFLINSSSRPDEVAHIRNVNPHLIEHNQINLNENLKHRNNSLTSKKLASKV